MKGLLIPLALMVAALPAQALELVVNGDFEQVLSVGWTQSTSGTGYYVSRDVGYDPDPDYEAYVRKSTGSGFVRLSQEVIVPNLDVAFAARAKLHAYATSSAWSAAALVVSYRDEEGSILGETAICATSHYCPWTSTPTFHMIQAPDNLWQDFGFILADELSNLPGVNPGLIKRVDIALYGTAADC